MTLKKHKPGTCPWSLTPGSWSWFLVLGSPWFMSTDLFGSFAASGGVFGDLLEDREPSRMTLWGSLEDQEPSRVTLWGPSPLALGPVASEVTLVPGGTNNLIKTDNFQVVFRRSEKVKASQKQAVTRRGALIPVAVPESEFTQQGAVTKARVPAVEGGWPGVPLTSAAPFDHRSTADQHVSTVTTIHHPRDAAGNPDRNRNLAVFLTWSSSGSYPWIVVVIPQTTTGENSAHLFTNSKQEKMKRRRKGEVEAPG